MISRIFFLNRGIVGVEMILAWGSFGDILP
jgi:hypothetical protein